MVRRSGVLTGIGNPEPELMDGQSTGNKALDRVINQCAKDCYETFFKGTEMDCDGIDAGVDAYDCIRFGIEPAYFGQNLKIINFLQNKAHCTYETGHAFGYYGSGIRSKIRYYESYTRSTKFTRFIDKWHPKLFKHVPTLESGGEPDA